MILRDALKLENNASLLVIGVLIIGVLYSLVFSPLLNQNEQLQAELKAEKELSIYLNMSEQKLSIITNYPTLSKEQISKQIKAAFQAQKIKLDNLEAREKSTLVNINNIAFKQLLAILQQLKTLYGIVVTEAQIERVDTGIVSAQLTFQMP
jgi:type II secretory pathway component PulM